MNERLIKQLPDYEKKSQLINQILFVAGKELEELELKNNQNNEELFIDTAIKALQIHAKDLGITLGSVLSAQQQRELITAHYRASFEQTTEETIKSVASAFSNGEVEINDTDTPGIYEIKFVGTVGIPNNMAGLKQTISTTVPAHLMFIYTYIFNTWSDLESFTWGQIETYTWDELLAEELI